jgi:hypothetical protein
LQLSELLNSYSETNRPRKQLESSAPPGFAASGIFFALPIVDQSGDPWKPISLATMHIRWNAVPEWLKVLFETQRLTKLLVTFVGLV